jgi:hypothetical protein
MFCMAPPKHCKHAQVIADKGLKKRLGQLERMLRLMPSRLQVNSRGAHTVAPATGQAPDENTAKLMGQANLIISNMGLPQAETTM